MGRVDRAIYKTYLAAWSPAYMVLPIFVIVLALSERGMQVRGLCTQLLCPPQCGCAGAA